MPDRVPPSAASCGAKLQPGLDNLSPIPNPRSCPFLQQVEVGIWAFDESGRTTYVNPRMAALIGRAAEELLGKRLEDFVAGSIDPERRRLHDEALRRGECAEETLQLRASDGRQLTARLALTPQFDDDSRYRGFLVVVLDISEQVELQSRLRDSERHLRAFFDGAGVIVGIGDSKGRWTEVNQQAVLAFGYPHEELIGRSVIELTHPDDREHTLRLFEQLKGGKIEGYRLEKRYLRKDGSCFWVDVAARAVRGPEDSAELFVAVATDITERKRVEAALRASNQRIAAILESISDGFFALDENMVVSYFNPAAERALGRSAEDVLGRHVFLEAFPEARQSVFEEQYSKALRERIALEFEAYFGVAPYENWYHVWVSPMADGISVFFEVTTERKRAQAEREAVQQRLLQLEREAKERAESELETLRAELVRKTQLATIGQLSASIAHELRNPLGTVRNATYLLKRRMGGEQRQLQEYVEIIERETAAADAIITELVAMSRGQPPNCRRVPLRSVAEQAWQRIASPDKVAWQLDGEASDCELYVDPAQFEQVLRNIFLNALQAMGSEGLIRISAARFPGHIDITIADTGPG
ncbi:MAG: PAS domain-containing sensor histidine kinase, partial [Planctomycetota bacterium]